MSLRINLGSGQRPFDNSCRICKLPEHVNVPALKETDHGHGFERNWTNVDIQERWKPDVVADGAFMPMFADGSAEMIVLHHTLEHYGCNEGSFMLNECFRILAKNGSLIVCVPEMRLLAKMWLRNEIDTQLYLTNVYGAYLGEEGDRHRWGGDSLSWATYLMNNNPWSSVKSFDWRTIPGADIAHDDRWICGLECLK